MDEALDDEQSQLPTSTSPAALGGDAEVNARMLSLVSRLAGDSLTTDPTMQEHFADEQVDSAMAQVVARIVNPGQIEDQEVDEAMLGVLDRVIAPVMIRSEFLDPDDELRDEIGVRLPIEETGPSEAQQARRSEDSEVLDELVSGPGASTRASPNRDSPSVPLPDSHRAAPVRSSVSVSLPEPSPASTALPQAPTAQRLPGTQEPAPSMAPAPTIPIAEPVREPARIKGPAPSVDGAGAETLGLLPDDGRLFGPGIFPDRGHVVPGGFRDLSDPFVSGRGGKQPRPRRDQVATAGPWQSLAQRKATGTRKDPDSEQRADTRAGERGPSGREDSAEAPKPGAASASDLSARDLAKVDPRPDGGQAKAGHVLNPAPREPGARGVRAASAADESWPFGERPARWPRYALIVVLVVLCLSFAALVVFAALSRASSGALVVEVQRLTV